MTTNVRVLIALPGRHPFLFDLNTEPPRCTQAVTHGEIRLASYKHGIS